jgi:hypothetical protein
MSFSKVKIHGHEDGQQKKNDALTPVGDDLDVRGDCPLMARCSVSFAVLRYFVFKAKRFGQLVDGLQVRIPVMEPCVPALVRLERTAQVSKGAAYCV